MVALPQAFVLAPQKWSLWETSQNHTLSPENLVLVKNHHYPNTEKLAPYFTGPYEILEIVSPNVVKINRCKQTSQLRGRHQPHQVEVLLDSPNLQSQEVLIYSRLGRREDGQGVVLQAMPEDLALQVRGPLDDKESLQDDRPDPPTGPVAMGQ
ncbi:hypothetical protein LAZ67_6003483 [Cordylochernes scorpioides]|uniref:Vitellogenin n=1 Tax=Cordylochernes scorpioides TaxID=51811 RepID=A0ABY6KMI4_9ARAC|nr:hypothetical protein LAZ67_6003483 [Cordylochernes scorpioides]